MNSLNKHVLVLNRDYRVLRTTTAKIAIISLFKGVVEVVDVRGDDYNTYDYESWVEYSCRDDINITDYSWVHSPNMALAVPYIIRIKNYSGYQRKKIRFSRKNIFIRDKYTCQYTGKRMRFKDLTLDHVVPRSKGGKTSWGNIVTCSRDVNMKKGDKTVEEAGLTLLNTPKQPDFIEFYPHKVCHESWLKFIL